MSIVRPEARLTLGPAAALSLAEAAVARLQVDLGLGEGHDCVLAWLWPGSRLAGAAPGDALSVALGTGDGAPEPVLGAEVTAVEARTAGTLLCALAPTHRLARAWVGRSWRATTLAEVVGDLLDEAGVEAGTVDAALPLPALHVDPRRSVWSTLHDLARRTGHQVATTPEGAVTFAPAPASAGGGLGGALEGAVGAVGAALGLGGSTLRAGADVLAGGSARRLPGEAAGPAGPRATSASATAWHLLAAEPDDGTTVSVLDPALRTREAADVATRGAAGAAARRARTARLRVSGRPGLRPGASVDVDAGSGAQPYRVLAVRHILDTATGYVCDLDLEAAS